MPRKNKYNPSGYPVLTKGPKNKSTHIKHIDHNVKRLSRFVKK